jgi:hypothetical protein
MIMIELLVGIRDVQDEKIQWKVRWYATYRSESVSWVYCQTHNFHHLRRMEMVAVSFNLCWCCVRFPHGECYSSISGFGRDYSLVPLANLKRYCVTNLSLLCPIKYTSDSQFCMYWSHRLLKAPDTVMLVRWKEVCCPISVHIEYKKFKPLLTFMKNLTHFSMSWL